MQSHRHFYLCNLIKPIYIFYIEKRCDIKFDMSNDEHTIHHIGMLFSLPYPAWVAVLAHFISFYLIVFFCVHHKFDCWHINLVFDAVLFLIFFLFVCFICYLIFNITGLECEYFTTYFDVSRVSVFVFLFFSFAFLHCSVLLV